MTKAFDISIKVLAVLKPIRKKEITLQETATFCRIFFVSVVEGALGQHPASMTFVFQNVNRTNVLSVTPSVSSLNINRHRRRQ